MFGFGWLVRAGGFLAFFVFACALLGIDLLDVFAVGQRIFEFFQK